MKPGDTTKLRREVKATAIPSGSPLSLPAETEVTLTQSLGGSHTVAGSFGLARIEEIKFPWARAGWVRLLRSRP